VRGQAAAGDVKAHQLLDKDAVAAGAEREDAADCSSQAEVQALHADLCTPAAAAATAAALQDAGTAASVDSVIDGLLDALVVAVEADEGGRVVDQLLLELMDELEAA
jgi:hypothetical protein